MTAASSDAAAAAASAAAADGGGNARLLEDQPCSDSLSRSSKLQQQQQQQTSLGRAAFLALFTVCTLTYSGYTLLLHLCETDSSGNYLWLTGSMVMLTELAKLSLSLCLLAGQQLWWERQGDSGESAAQPPRVSLGPRDLLAYGVPAGLYTVTNNLGAYLQLQMDPVSFQILSNLKILATALLFRAVMRRDISRVQWLALLLLFVAGVANSIGGLAEKSRSAATLHVTPVGLALLLVYCTVSGMAGVYTEFVMKRHAALSVHLQNSLLYVYGIGLNLALFSAQTAAYSRDWSLLRGFSGLTWTLVASQAVGGIAMGMLMKFASNIAKLFVVSTAMLVTTVATVVLFHFSVNVYCVIAFACVVASQCLYYNGCHWACGRAQGARQ